MQYSIKCRYWKLITDWYVRMNLKLIRRRVRETRLWLKTPVKVQHIKYKTLAEDCSGLWKTTLITHLWKSVKADFKKSIENKCKEGQNTFIYTIQIDRVTKLGKLTSTDRFRQTYMKALIQSSQTGRDRQKLTYRDKHTDRHAYRQMDRDILQTERPTQTN